MMLIVRLLLSSETDVDLIVLSTLTVHFAVREESFVVQVITAVPCETAVTTPSVLTDATEGSLEAHSTLLLVAFAGSIVGFNIRVAVSYSSMFVSLSLTPVA